MSDNYLQLVSVDPFWLPSPEASMASLSILRKFVPAAESVSAESKKHVTFFDAGTNLERITCPSCGSDLRCWWGGVMDEAWNSKFENLSVVTPCCHTSTSMKNLVYTWPMAFGRFALVITNPGVTSLANEQIKEIELAVGSSLKVIWKHL